MPALLVVGGALLAIPRITKWDALLLGLLGLQVIAYAAYWHQGQFVGPRFLYTALPAVVVLIARAPFLIRERMGAVAGRFALVLVLGCIAVSWAAPPTLRVGVQGMARQLHDNRRVLKADYAGAVRDANLTNALVFLREPFRAADPTVRISSESSLTDECRTEITEDARLGGAPLGPAVPLEPIGADGRIDGEVIFVADLGERNEVLRTRFGDRTWYRLTVVRPGDRSLRPVITPYQ